MSSGTSTSRTSAGSFSISTGRSESEHARELRPGLRLDGDPPAADPPLAAAYRAVFDELRDADRYRTWSVAGFYVDANAEPDPQKVNVVVRIDCDSGLHLSAPLARELAARGIQASHYFLTHPDRHYQVFGSGIPAQVARLGQEVGLHTDHFYEEIALGKPGLKSLREDLRRLSAEAGARVRGFVYHGHPDMDRLRRSNWELTKNVTPAELEVDYHDGLRSCYIAPGAGHFAPRCDVRITDYLGYPWSWGWNYYPSLPLRKLRQARPGQVVHLAFHTASAFRYWEHWTNAFAESMPRPDGMLGFARKSLAIRFRHGVLRGRSLREIFYYGTQEVLGAFLAKGVGLFWRRPAAAPQDISWEAGRERIFERGIDFWRGHVEQLGLASPGQTVLEVGSGNGQWLLAFARDAAKVYGVEPWRPIREYSVQRIAEFPAERDRIEVLAAGAEALPLPDNSVDTILCAGVLMFTHQDTAIAEMARVLRPGGRVCLLVNGLGYFVMYVLNGLRYRDRNRMRYGLRGLFATLLKWQGIAAPGPTAVHYAEMEEKLASHGLRLVETRLFLQEREYPEEHLGFPTNYAFTAVRV